MPFRSRTVRVAVTWKPLTGYSMRLRTPGARLDVYWTVSLAIRRFCLRPRCDVYLAAGRDAVDLEPHVARPAIAEAVPADEHRVVRVVRERDGLLGARGADEHRRVEAERIAVDVVVVVAPGAHLVAGPQGGVEQRRRARADPAREGALRLGPAVDDRAAGLVALGPGDGSDGVPEVERGARRDDVAVDQPRRDPDVRAESVPIADREGGRPLRDLAHLRAERPWPRRWSAPAAVTLAVGSIDLPVPPARAARRSAPGPASAWLSTSIL